MRPRRWYVYGEANRANGKSLLCVNCQDAVLFADTIDMLKL